MSRGSSKKSNAPCYHGNPKTKYQYPVKHAILGFTFQSIIFNFLKKKGAFRIFQFLMFTINNLTCRRNTLKKILNKLLEKVELKVQEWVTVGDHKYHVSSPTAGTGHCSGLREHWCKRKKRTELFYVIEGTQICTEFSSLLLCYLSSVWGVQLSPVDTL